MTWGADKGPETILEPTLFLNELELPGMPAFEPENSESDDGWLPPENPGVTYRAEGWRGKWARELIAKAEKKLPLGESSVTVWHNDWGLKLKLEVRRRLSVCGGLGG